MCKVVISYLLACVSSDVIISLYSPLPFWFCHLQIYLKRVTIAILMLSVNCIMIVRYALIFWLKTPSIVHDDFWNRFLNIWILGSAAVKQLVHRFILVREPLNFYICINDYPLNDQQLPKDKMFSTVVLIVLSLLTCMVTSFRIELFKRKIGKTEKCSSSCTLRGGDMLCIGLIGGLVETLLWHKCGWVVCSKTWLAENMDVGD